MKKCILIFIGCFLFMTGCSDNKTLTEEEVTLNTLTSTEWCKPVQNLGHAFVVSQLKLNPKDSEYGSHSSSEKLMLLSAEVGLKKYSDVDRHAEKSWKSYDSDSGNSVNRISLNETVATNKVELFQDTKKLMESVMKNFPELTKYIVDGDNIESAKSIEVYEDADDSLEYETYVDCSALYSVKESMVEQSPMYEFSVYIGSRWQYGVDYKFGEQSSLYEMAKAMKPQLPISQLKVSKESLNNTRWCTWSGGIGSSDDGTIQTAISVVFGEGYFIQDYIFFDNSTFENTIADLKSEDINAAYAKAKEFHKRAATIAPITNIENNTVKGNVLGSYEVDKYHFYKDASGKEFMLISSPYAGTVHMQEMFYKCDDTAVTQIISEDMQSYLYFIQNIHTDLMEEHSIEQQ